MTQQELLDMPLHSYKRVTDYFSVWRVLGGWVYTYYLPNGGTSCFVREPQKPLTIVNCCDKVNCNFPKCDCK